MAVSKSISPDASTRAATLALGLCLVVPILTHRSFPPVVRDGRVVGILTMDNAGELMMVQAAVRKAVGTRRAA
jgi:hypothetical protein